MTDFPHTQELEKPATFNPEDFGEPYSFINPASAHEDSRLILRGNGIIETNCAVAELTPDADFILRCLMSRRVWMSRSDFVRQGYGFDANLPRLTRIFKAARENIEAVTFDQDKSILLTVGETRNRRYRLHPELYIEEQFAFVPPDRISLPRPKRWGINFSHLNGQVYDPSSTTPSKPAAKVKKPASGSVGRGSSSERAQDRRRNGWVPKDEDNVRQYLNEIGKYPLLNTEQVTALAQKIEKGIEAKKQLNLMASEEGTEVSATEKRLLRKAVKDGAEAQSQLINSNLRLVVSIAKKYQGSRVPLLDLIQEGNLGLIRSVEKFDWRKGFSFSTYAVWWIKQAIRRGIVNNGSVIRYPQQIASDRYNVQLCFSVLRAEYGRDPSVEEIADRIGESVENVRKILAMPAQPLSLDSPINDENDTTHGDFVKDPNSLVEDKVLSSLTPEIIAQCLLGLDEIQKRVLTLRFNLDRSNPRGKMSRREIGEIVGLNRNKVNEVEQKALAKLRKSSTDYY